MICKLLFACRHFFYVVTPDGFWGLGRWDSSVQSFLLSGRGNGPFKVISTQQDMFSPKSHCNQFL